MLADASRWELDSTLAALAGITAELGIRSLRSQDEKTAGRATESTNNGYSLQGKQQQRYAGSHIWEPPKTGHQEGMGTTAGDGQADG